MKRLPLEIWSTVFNDHIRSVKQLGECRLVCSAWDHIAESAMFGSELAIDSTNAAKFYYHLSNKSAKGNLIKHLDFDEDSQIEQLRADIVQLGFTPTIQSLAGYMEDEQYIQQLIDIVQASPIKFSNMKSIVTHLPQARNFSKLAYLFKDTLQELSLEVTVSLGTPLGSNEAILSLDEFVQLEHLSLDVWGNPKLHIWEDLLQKCYRLTSLRIEYDDERMEDDGDDDDMAARRRLQNNNWVIYNTQKFSNLQRFEIFGGIQHGLCRYFLQKFPNLQDIQFHLDFIPPNAYEELLGVLQALRSRENYHIHYTIHDEEGFNFAAMFESAKKEAKSLTIQYSNCSITNHHTALVIVNSQKAAISYKISLPKLSANASFSFLDINCASDFCSLVLDFAHLRIIDPGLRKIQVLSQAMSTLDQLDRLELSIDHLKETDINDHQLPVHKKLTSMKITGAEMNANVLSSFGACFPALTSLTLDQCQIATTDDTVCKVYPVALPQRWLRTIAIVGLPSSERPTLLRIELLSKASGLYFLLLPFQSTPVQLGKEQFETHLKGPSFIFSVTCQSVNTVRVRQGDISLLLHVDNYV